MISFEDDTARSALSRGAGLAAWRQIADALGADIEAGRLSAGTQLATEATLAERFGVNRHTVRRALGVLAERGLVRAAQGRGTFVEQARLPYPIGLRTRFSEIVSQAGREAWGDLTGTRDVAADPETAEALQVETGAPVLELGTIHLADGVPLSMAKVRLPLPRFSGFAEAYAETGSITRAFEHFGVRDYVRHSTRIGSRLATPDEAERLELVPGRVVLVIASVNVDEQGVPIQVTRSMFSADRVELVIDG